MKVWDKISSLVTEQQGNTRRTQVAAKPAQPAMPAETAPGVAAASAALSMMPEATALDAIAAGQVQLLNLDTVRAALGPRWERVSTQVHMIAESILRKALGPGDVFTRVAENEYVTIFATHQETQARLLMRSVAQQIHEKLFGVDPVLNAVAVSAMVMTLDRKALEAASSQPGFVSAALREAAAAGHPPAIAAGQGPQSGVAIAPGTLSSGQLVAAERQSVSRTGDVASAIANSLNDLGKQPARREAAGQWVAPTAGVDLTGAAPVSKPAAGGATNAPAPSGAPSATPAGARSASAPMPTIGDLKMIYRPIWDVAKQSVSAYRLHVSIEVDGAFMDLSEFSLTYDDPKVLQAVNSLVIRRTMNEMLGIHGESRKALYFAPVSRQFINGENGLRYLIDESQRLTPAMQAQLVWEVTDAYYGAWPALTPKVAILRRYCKAVGIRLSLDHRDFEGITATGAAYVAGNLADHNWPERQALAEMNRFAEASSKARVRSIIDGLQTSSLVIAAVSAGADLVCGPVVGEDTPAPCGIYDLSAEGIYRRRREPRPER